MLGRIEGSSPRSRQRESKRKLTWTLHRVLMLNWLMGVCPKRVPVLIDCEPAFVSGTIVRIGRCDMLAIGIHCAQVYRRNPMQKLLQARALEPCGWRGSQSTDLEAKQAP